MICISLDIIYTIMEYMHIDDINELLYCTYDIYKMNNMVWKMLIQRDRSIGYLSPATITDMLINNRMPIGGNTLRTVYYLLGDYYALKYIPDILLTNIHFVASLLHHYEHNEDFCIDDARYQQYSNMASKLLIQHEHENVLSILLRCMLITPNDINNYKLENADSKY